MDKTPFRVKAPAARAMSKAPRFPAMALYMPTPAEVIRIGALSDNVKVVNVGTDVPVLTATNETADDIVTVSEDPATPKLKQELQVPPLSVIVVWA
jgi:hypothetical protein